MEPTEKGKLEIIFKNGSAHRYEDFDYYTMQHPFLVIAEAGGRIIHYNSDTIEYFIYTTKENN